jgi:hypothetical protein
VSASSIAARSTRSRLNGSRPSLAVAVSAPVFDSIDIFPGEARLPPT